MREPGEIDEGAVTASVATAAGLPREAVTVAVVDDDGAGLSLPDGRSVVVAWLSPLIPSRAQVEAFSAAAGEHDAPAKVDVTFPGIALGAIATILADLPPAALQP